MDDDAFDAAASSGTPLMTLDIAEQPGDRLGVAIKFHKEVSGKRLMSALGTAVQGLLGTGKKLAAGYGLSEDVAVALLLGVDHEGSIEGLGEVGPTPD